MKPLLIPLRSEYFEAFIAGKKTIEYRLLRYHWNPTQVFVGRRVILSRGYTVKGRRDGQIITVDTFAVADVPFIRAVYPDAASTALVLAFGIKLL